MSQINLFISKLDPDNLFNKLIPPLLHNLQGGVQLRIQNPQEYEALIRYQMQRKLANFMIAHCIVF